jgi:hypothetical protein
MRLPISALARVPRSMRCRLAGLACVPVITSLPAAQERHAGACLPDFRQAEEE